jgi:hypothetical protein
MPVLLAQRVRAAGGRALVAVSGRGHFDSSDHGAARDVLFLLDCLKTDGPAPA